MSARSLFSDSIGTAPFRRRYKPANRTCCFKDANILCLARISNRFPATVIKHTFRQARARHVVALDRILQLLRHDTHSDLYNSVQMQKFR